MVFCNKPCTQYNPISNTSHNPYFSRWFSAIDNQMLLDINKFGHNPYFSRWFSAIKKSLR